MLRKIGFGIVGLLFLVAGSAQAQSHGGRSSLGTGSFVYSKSGVLVDFGLFYGQSEAAGNPSTQNFKENVSIYDIKLGYITDSNWYFGGLYSVRNDSDTLGTTNGKAGGLGAGYFFHNNFNFRAYYRFQETYGDYTDGSGFQLDLEYKVAFSSNFYIGALISHHQTQFTSNNTIAGFSSYTQKDTYPAVTLGFLID